MHQTMICLHLSYPAPLILEDPYSLVLSVRANQVKGQREGDFFENSHGVLVGEMKC